MGLAGKLDEQARCLIGWSASWLVNATISEAYPQVAWIGSGDMKSGREVTETSG